MKNGHMEYFFSGKYKNKKRLGKGAYGSVYLVEDQHGNLFALKLINIKEIEERPHLREQINNYIKCMKKMDSPHIVKLYEVHEDSTNIQLLVQYCQQLVEIQAKLSNKIFNLEKATHVLSHVIIGIQELHQQKIVHRNVKLSSIFLKILNGNEIFKIENLQYSTSQQNNYGWNYDNIDYNRTLLLNQVHKAPQIFKSLDNTSLYGTQVDIWAFGVLFYFMLNLDYPFRTNPHWAPERKEEELTKQATQFSYKASVQNSRKQIIANCTPEVEELFYRMFHPNPSQRITFHEIKKSPLFIKYFPQEIYEIRNDEIKLDFFDELKQNQLKKKQNILELSMEGYNKLKISYEQQLHINRRIKNQYENKLKYFQNIIHKNKLAEKQLELQLLKKQIAFLKKSNTQLTQEKFSLSFSVQYYQDNILRKLDQHVNTFIKNFENKDSGDVFKMFVPALKEINQKIIELQNQNVKLRTQVKQKAEELQLFFMELNNSEIIRRQIERRNNYFLAMRNKIKQFQKDKEDIMIQKNKEKQQK